MGFSHSHRAYRAAIIVFTVFAVGGQVVAQGGYPSRPIRVFTITPPGGPSDIAARLIGDRLLPALGQPVIVEPKVGAGGSLAVGHVAKSAPDGYSLVMSGDAAIVTNLHLYKKLPFDPVKDLVPISQIGFTPNILAVSNDLPAKTVQELVTLARTQPGKLTYAHGGNGFSQHLAGELFKVRAGVKVQAVPFRSGPAIMPDLMTGRVSLCFCNITAILPLAKENKLRALAITSLKRWHGVPDIPTMGEAGFPDFDVNAWSGLLAPAGTPPAIVETLHRDIARVLAMPDVRAKFEQTGTAIIGNAPAEFAAVIRTEIPQRQKVIDAAGIERM